jgi:hypothetical protein
MVVRCVAALQWHIFLLSRPLSSHAKRALIMEEPFTSPIQTVVKVFYIGYVVMTVAQHTKVIIRMVSLLSYE